MDLKGVFLILALVLLTSLACTTSYHRGLNAAEHEVCSQTGEENGFENN